MVPDTLLPKHVEITENSDTFASQALTTYYYNQSKTKLCGRKVTQLQNKYIIVAF